MSQQPVDYTSTGPHPPGVPMYRKRKPRTAFTNQQVMEMEKKFEMDRYLTPGDRASLAAKLNLDETQVLLWFQNRRAKLKRELDEQKGAIGRIIK